MPSSESLFYHDCLTSWIKPNRCYALTYPYFEMNPHTHPEIEIMYVVHGTSYVTCYHQNQDMEEYVLKEGDYIFLDAHIPHQLRVFKEHASRVLNLEIGHRPKNGVFDLQHLQSLSSSVYNFWQDGPKVFTATDDRQNLYHIITQLQTQFTNALDSKENDVEANLLLSQLLVELSRQYKRPKGSYKGSHYVRRAMQYMDACYEDDITVGAISRHCNISLSYLQRLFQEENGFSMIDYVNHLRIEKAKFLLETSTLPVIDIAVTVGYHNRQHFTYVFKQKNGCSPSTYRKQKGNEQLFLGF